MTSELKAKAEYVMRKITDKYLAKLFLSTADRYPVILLTTLFAIIILATVAILLFLAGYQSEFFLMDDGYYNLARVIFDGSAGIWHQRRYPGLPLLFTVLHIFPDFVHPLIRIYLTILTLGGSFFIGRKLLGNSVSNRRYFVLGIFVLLNPLIIHWSIKSAPEPFVTLFLGLILLLYRAQIFNSSLMTNVLLPVSIVVGIAVKPVFMLIPGFICLYYLIKKNQKLFFTNLVIAVIVIMGFISLKSLTRMEQSVAKSDSYGTNDLLATSFLIKVLLENPPDEVYKTQYNTGLYKNLMLSKKVSILYDDYRIGFYRNNPDAPETDYIISYIKDNFGYWTLSKIMSPILFFTFSLTPQQVVLRSAITFIILFLAFRQLRKYHKEGGQEIEVFLVVLLGFSAVYFMTYSFTRYSFPVIFYLSMYAWTILPVPEESQIHQTEN